MGKRGRSVAAGFGQDPLPLRRIYVLAEGEALAVEPLPPRAALLELVRHSYAVRALRSAGASSNFLRCASLAKTVSVRRLRRPQRLQALPELVRAVEKDLADA
jgi:hypothetical protein